MIASQVCLGMILYHINILTLSLLLDPTVDLPSARLCSSDEINFLQVCLVILLCGTEEFLQKE